MVEQKLKDGANLQIRQVMPQDAVAVVAYMQQTYIESDNLVMGPGQFNFTPEQEEAYIAAVMGSRSVMLGGFLQDGALVALGSLEVPSPSRICHTAELGLSVAKALWNAGVGTAMMRALLEAAKEKEIVLVHLGVRAANGGAIHLYEKMGFEKVGVLAHYFNIDGQYDDKVIMALRL